MTRPLHWRGPIFGQGVEAILIGDAAERLVGFFPFSVASRRYGIRLPLILGWTYHFAPLGTPLVDRDFVTRRLLPSSLALHG